MRNIVPALIWLTFATPLAIAQSLKAPPGFEVVEYADHTLANDIHCMTLDPMGRPVVAGRGYLRILADDNNDGKADRAIEFANSPKDGAMGLLWEGNTLYATGDGGLRQFTTKNGDQADGPSKLLRAMKTGGEHSTHAIRRGPDGWLYVLCGNNAEINKSYAELPTSPIKEPIAGCVLRFSPRPAGEGLGVRGSEIVAHGFRNSYGMDFNLDGDLFTYDSDNERCVSLPWYEPTRFYHVIDGRHYGWLNPQHAVAWRRPPYFLDVVPPVATLGRGSPTGVVCYRHNQFPPEFHGGFFLGDWTFGKIYFVKLERQGATYKGEPRVFLESTGDNGFAPTACAVDERTGDLFVSIGGRGTRGAVYRIRHTERFRTLKDKLAPLPMARRSLEWNAQMRKDYETKLMSKSSADHLWALQVARRQNSFLAEKDVTTPFANDRYFDDLSIRNAYADLIDDLLLAAQPELRGAFAKALKNNLQISQAMSFGVGVLRSDPTASLSSGLELLRKSKLPERRLDGVRLVQLAHGDVGARKSIGTIWEGYSPRQQNTDERTAKAIAAAFPSKHADLDRELARTLGMLAHDDDDVRERVLSRCVGEPNPGEHVHYLACYALLGGKRNADETKIVAATLLDLDHKIVALNMNRDSNWQPRVRELYIGLTQKDASLHKAMVEHADFGRPDHALFANVDGFPKEQAARIFLERWQKNKNYVLTAAVVQLFDVLPSRNVLPVVRERWGDIGQQSAFLPLLAKAPHAEDRVRFVEGLNSPQANVVMACVEGLDKVGPKVDVDESFALIRALRRVAEDIKPKRQPAKLAELIAKRLAKNTGQSFGTDAKRWIAWLEREHPEFGKRLANPDGVDVAKWDKRLLSIDWNVGEVKAGKAVYTKANCVQCHSGSQALGPDLVGATNRFSRQDLFTAIVQPSKDVPARYQMTVVETDGGKTYQGIVIYDAVDSLILQGPAATIRVDGRSIVSRRVSTQSLMPAGSLDALTDREISDLFAYLKSLAK